MRLLFVILCMAVSCSSAVAERATFKFLKSVSVSELNAILDTERAEFVRSSIQGQGYQLPPPSVATNDVNLFTVRYYSRRPEIGGQKVLVSGLLALPKISDMSTIPLLAFQHATVMGRYEVPSYAFTPTNPSGYPHYPQAYESRYMVALFAGNGYAVMAADYFGFGDSARLNEAYFMKRSTAQANYDLYLDVKKFLGANSIKPSKFVLGGQSQGALNTTGFLELLEARGVKVTGAFTAASPNDPYAVMNALLFHPRAIDASWMSTLISLTAFSCENYGGKKGLAKSVIDPKYYMSMKSVYDRTYAGPLGLYSLLVQWQNVPFVAFLQPAYRDPTNFANSDYGRCMAAAETFRTEFKTPLKMYYSTDDEVVRTEAALLAIDYQSAITSTPDAPESNKISAVSVQGAGHRLTFVSGAIAAKAWMDTIE